MVMTRRMILGIKLRRHLGRADKIDKHHRQIQPFGLIASGDLGAQQFSTGGHFRTTKIFDGQIGADVKINTILDEIVTALTKVHIFKPPGNCQAPTTSKYHRTLRAIVDTLQSTDAVLKATYIAAVWTIYLPP